MTDRRSLPRVVTVLGLVLILLMLTTAMLTLVQAKGAAASIAVAKEADPTVVRIGDPVDYVITVDNDGDSDLTGVTVDDDLNGCILTEPSGDDGNLVLETDETWTYSCSVTAGAQDIVNTATVTATGALSETVSGSAQATVDVIQPAIDIEKQAAPMTVRVGDTVNYTITVDNSGDSDLTSVGVDDDLAGCTLSVPSGDNGNLTLETFETWIYTCSVTAGSVDIVNTATVSATDETGGTVTASAGVTVDVIYPGIEIAKTPDTQTVASGSTASFTIVITNTGDAPLTDVTVLDARAPDCDETFERLSARQRRSYSCAVANVTDGFINSVVVTGTPGAGGDVTDVDAAKVRLNDTLACPDDMGAYWKLDEVGGPTYDDFYYGHDGECAGTCPAPVTGRVNGGQAFNSNNNTGVDVPVVPGDDSFDWGVQDSFSIEFWMRADSPSTCAGTQVVVGRDDSGTSLHWWVGCLASGLVRFRLTDTGGTSAAVLGSTAITDGVWHHIVAVRDASANTLRIHVDGTEESAESATFSTGFGSPMAALNIGWLNLSPGYHFDGILDEVALYNRALSADEIRQHYNEVLAGRWYCQPGAYAPIIVSTAVTEATSGRQYIYDVEAIGNPVPTYTLTIHPTGMTISPTTGLISWVPTVAQEGSHDVEVTATNSLGADTESFTIAVGEGTLCPADMIAYWKLDEASGAEYYSDFYDGHDGVCAEGLNCPTPATGHVGGGQAFGGTTGIDIPANVAFDWGVQDSFSIEFWMRADSARTCVGTQVAVGRDDSATGLQWWVGCRAGGLARFRLTDTGGTSAAVLGSTAIIDGAWHHIVAVRDASANVLRIYVDGVEEDSTPESYTQDFDSSVDLNIGHLSSGFHFEGVLDEVALYDRALSPDEIRQHYNGGEASPGYCINPDIAVDKTADPQAVSPGDTVTYAYTVTNPGDDPLSNVSVSDDKCSPVSSAEGDDDHDDRLDLSEIWTYTCSMRLITDTTNIVTVTGMHSLGGTVSHTDTLSVRAVEMRDTYLPLIMKY